MLLHKEHRAIDKVIRRYGFHLDVTPGGHCGVYNANNDLIATTSATARDPHVLKNYVRQKIRRATGIKVPL